MSGPGRIMAGALAALVGMIFMVASGAGFELALAIGVLLVLAADFLLRMLRQYFVELAASRLDVTLSAKIMEISGNFLTFSEIL